MNSSTKNIPSLYILGTRGVPAAHGGFETFAHRFALHMREQGWSVTVYCQVDDGADGPVVDYWEGVRRVTFASGSGAIGTMAFDWKCVMHAIREKGVMLVLGYNTAIFSALLRLARKAVITNMDGIEWKRAKWPWHGRIWLYFNEWIGALTSTKLIADHPEIEKHLETRRSKRDIVMIPYGADRVSRVPEDAVRSLGLEPGRYVISIGRIEPENNILPMIQAYVREERSFSFVCLGKLQGETNQYHADVLASGEGRVAFLGAIYDPDVVAALRFHALAYCHGHSVGGTNPSLVEALGAGNAVIAHDNKYNRWVAGPEQLYFSSVHDCADIFAACENFDSLSKGGHASLKRHEEAFQWSRILSQYQAVCDEYA